jgi:DNA-directed RNA polymerase specialized sigma24 family protein
MHADSTCWTVIHGASAGNLEDRDEFVRRYSPVVRAYLEARWQSPSLRPLLDDGVQDVFIECFREGGVLGRADAARKGGFRPFLFGVVRNVALRLETGLAKRRRREGGAAEGAVDLDAVPSPEDTLSVVFDRAWATALVQAAATIHADRARDGGADAMRRVDLLRLRFFEGLPIRDIARRWDASAATLHHEYAKARDEFREALRTVVAFDSAGPMPQIEGQIQTLFSVLGRT